MAPATKSKSKSSKGPKPSRLVRSVQGVVQAAGKNRTAVNRAWASAPECAVFRRVEYKPATRAAAGKPGTKAGHYKRGNRIMGSHAMRTLFSAGAAQAGAKLAREGVELRTVLPAALGEHPTVEVPGFPALPSTGGAVAYELEAQATAFNQTVLQLAVEVKRCLAGSDEKASTQRLMPKHVRLAANAVSRRIRAMTALGLTQTVAPRIAKKKAAKKGKKAA